MPPEEPDIATVLGAVAASPPAPRAMRGPAPTALSPAAYRTGMLRLLSMNFLGSLTIMPDVAVAEAALCTAKQDPTMLGAISATELRSAVAFVASKGTGAMPAEFRATPAWEAAATQHAAVSAAFVAYLAAGLPPNHPLAPLLEECDSEVTDLGCASAVVRLLKSLDDLTPVVDSVEAELLKEAELREKCIDWEDLERTYGYLGVTITSFIQQFDKMRAALIKVDRGTSLDIVQQLVHFLTADASPGPKGSRQRKVYHMMSRLQTDFDLGAFPDLTQLRVFTKRISDLADAGLDTAEAAAQAAAAASRPRPAKPMPDVRTAASAGSAPRAAAAVALEQPTTRLSYHHMSPAVHFLAKNLKRCFRCGSKVHMLDGCTAKERGCALCGGVHKADDCPQPPAAKNE